LSTFFKNKFPGFEEILDENKDISNQNKPHRFEFGKFSDFNCMNECLKKKFIDFDGTNLSLIPGLILYIIFSS
jgi:hypothetical protein